MYREYIWVENMDYANFKIGTLVKSKIPYHGNIPIGTVVSKVNNTTFVVRWHFKKSGLPFDLCMPWEIESYSPERYEDFQDKIKDRMS